MISKKIILIIAGITIGLTTFVVYTDNRQGQFNKPFSISGDTDSALSPTSFPFQEMTIPYQRGQIYKSELKAMELVGSNGSYSSYLTSYDSDDLNINGLLTIPTGEEPTEGWPAIVFIHGYIPPTQYQTLGKYNDYVNYLARNGFVVFKIDLRGHGNSEGEPSGAYYSEDYVVDTLHAYSALQNTDFVNPNAIGLWGHSMAGNIVLRTMAAKPTIPAGAIWAGAVYTYEDMRAYGIQDSSYVRPPSNAPRQQRRNQLFQEFGEFSTDNPFWQQVVPTNYLNDFLGAIQLNHAVNDDVVNIEYSRNLNRLLDDTTVTHELHEYSSGGHNITGVAFVEAMENTVRFYKTYLN